MQEALKLPNKTHPDSPIGGEDSNKVVKKVGGVTAVLPKKMSHIEIAEKFDLLDFNSASKLTGNKFVFFKNEAALLELALC